MNTLLELRNIRHAYGRQTVVNDLSLALKKGAIGCLLGPSGCGKTTVLRCIAGFEPISAGEIALNGVVISNADFSLPPERRHIGMVFQDYALFPHLTVQANVGFGLHRMQKTERAARTAEMLKTVGLADVADKYPHQLSGGQQQRVALARALAPKPDLLLLDEPFSNLDVTLRGRLSLEVRDILKSQNATAILVTHDQDEAFAIADEIGVMHQGEIQQWDTGYNLYHRPANRFVANFIGQGVFLPGKILDPHHVEIELGTLAGEVPHQCMPDCQLCREGNPVDVLIRPDDIVHDDASPLQAAVMHKAFRGADIMYTLRLPGGGTALSLVPSHHNHAIGEKIGIKLEADHVVAFSQPASN
ncbi:ABC transporter ATP-binding protein [Nitrosospira sp. Nsp1]|uniref:ABC transporter ATP-binding protein n=1 Tax=Nitrosospira sp. Nsp1 TaxID=136547 RepID=UPI0008865FE4|nr:ABC transporter ATP-binding protein [Nitrosospira sp. Nsp1]SCX44252.1 iron(III) transport system ATP-binding protein [Nitrosospira sp. Nsp1]